MPGGGGIAAVTASPTGAGRRQRATRATARTAGDGPRHPGPGPAPARAASGRRGRREHRPALQRDPGVADRLQAVVRVAHEAAAQERLDVRRGRLREGGEVGLAGQHRREHVAHRLAVEEPAADEQLVEHDAEGPDVGATIRRLAARLLRRHVGGGAEDEAGGRARAGEGGRLREAGRAARARVVVPAPGLGEAEVEHLHLAVGGQLDVGGLEVAVDDALLVGLLERLGDLAARRRGPRPPAAAPRFSRSARSSPSTSSMTRKLALVPSASVTLSKP